MDAQGLGVGPGGLRGSVRRSDQVGHSGRSCVPWRRPGRGLVLLSPQLPAVPRAPRIRKLPPSPGLFWAGPSQIRLLCSSCTRHGPRDTGGRRRGEVSSQPRPPTHRLQGPGAHLQEARGRQPGRELRPRAQEPPRTAPSLPRSREPGLPSSQDSGPTPDAAATPLPWPAGGQAGPGSTRSPSEVGRTRLCPPAQTQVPWALFGREPPLAQAQACCPPRGAAWRPGSGSALTPRGLGLGLPSASWHRRPGSQASAPSPTPVPLGSLLC